MNNPTQLSRWKGVMGNRNVLKVHVLGYLIANTKVCGSDSSYAWMIEKATSRKDT